MNAGVLRSGCCAASPPPCFPAVVAAAQSGNEFPLDSVWVATAAKLVAITVILIAPVKRSSITAPKIMLASGSAESWIKFIASLISNKLISGQPVTFTNRALAPWIEVSSSNGLEIARCTASIARFSPDAVPVPINATPRPSMIDFTSAKSTLISPGSVTMSEIPRTAWRNIPSASPNASLKGIALVTELKSLSFGIVMTLSTQPLSSASPWSA